MGLPIDLGLHNLCRVCLICTDLCALLLNGWHCLCSAILSGLWCFVSAESMLFTTVCPPLKRPLEVLSTCQMGSV